jgi:hypothetical protein
LLNLVAALIGGTATMYKVTGDSYWKEENAVRWTIRLMIEGN